MNTKCKFLNAQNHREEKRKKERKKNKKKKTLSVDTAAGWPYFRFLTWQENNQKRSSSSLSSATEAITLMANVRNEELRVHTQRGLGKQGANERTMSVSRCINERLITTTAWNDNWINFHFNANLVWPLSTFIKMKEKNKIIIITTKSKITEKKTYHPSGRYKSETTKIVTKLDLFAFLLNINAQDVRSGCSGCSACSVCSVCSEAQNSIREMGLIAWHGLTKKFSFTLPQVQS